MAIGGSRDERRGVPLVVISYSPVRQALTLAFGVGTLFHQFACNHGKLGEGRQRAMDRGGGFRLRQDL